jgi:uncharacterized protein YozE (UPF0346 family)
MEEDWIVDEKERIGTLALIRVRKEELLERLKENRAGHRELFLKAQDGYREKAIKELESALDRAKNQTAERVYVALPFPEDHTKDYDHIIAMVEMSIDDLFELNQNDFARYVLDDWEWKAAFTQSVMAYTAAV